MENVTRKEIDEIDKRLTITIQNLAIVITSLDNRLQAVEDIVGSINGIGEFKIGGTDA